MVWRIGIVGPLLGTNRGSVLSQGEVLAHLLRRAGYIVVTTSSRPNRVLRLADMMLSTLRWQRQVDLVNLMVFSGNGFVPVEILSLQIKGTLRKPLVLTLRGGNLPAFASRHPDRVKRVLRRADVIVSPSNYLAHFFRGWGFRVEVIPNVLDLADYPFRCRRQLCPRLLWMRTFHPVYQPEMAVEAFEIVLRNYPDATLTMAGADKGLESTIRQMVVDRGITQSVNFPGFLDRQQKQQQFASHDIYLHTNRIDNMPVSVLEAAAFGLPVVATRVGGIPFLLEHEQTALLVDQSDSSQMAAAVLRLLMDPELSGRLSEKGRALAERCGWDRVRRQWEEIFSAAIAKPYI